MSQVLCCPNEARSLLLVPGEQEHLVVNQSLADEQTLLPRYQCVITLLPLS